VTVGRTGTSVAVAGMDLSVRRNASKHRPRAATRGQTVRSGRGESVQSFLSPVLGEQQLHSAQHQINRQGHDDHDSEPSEHLSIVQRSHALNDEGPAPPPPPSAQPPPPRLPMPRQASCSGQ